MEELKEKETVSYYAHSLVELYAHKTAILWKGGYRTQPFSYLDLYHNALRLVALLYSLGIKKGDRVCVWAYNSPAWVVFLLGCAMSGIIVVPLDFHSRAEFVDLIIRKVGAKALFLSRLKEIEAPVLKIYVEDLFERLGDVKPVLLSELPPIEPQDLLGIVYTSGTTGDPKGVMITNGNLVSNVRSMRLMMPLDDSYSFISILPLSHLLEQVVGLLLPLRFGASVLYARTRKSSEMTKLVKKHRVTTIVCVPLFLDTIKDSLLRMSGGIGAGLLKVLLPISAKLPLKIRRALFYPVRRAVGGNLRFFFCGGAKLNESTEDFWNALGIPILQGYGLTEASPVVSCNVRGQYKVYSVGRPVPGQDIYIAKDGEILIRGPNITSGYYLHQEATRTAFEEGWFKTGDIGELDPEGFLFIRGRKKEMILTASGLNVFPQDIEAALNELPSVKESCVFALEEEGRAKIYAAIVPQKSPAAPTVEEILIRANEKLGAHQRIHGGTFWHQGDLPKTPSLKIKRQEVARTIKHLQAEKPVPPSGAHEGFFREEERAVGTELRQLIAIILDLSPLKVRDDSKLVDDLGFDSLGLAELVTALEEWFRLDFDESVLKPQMTVADLARLIENWEGKRVKFPRVAWARTAPAAALRKMFQGALNLCIKGAARVEIKGRENLAGLKLPVIFAANHVGYLDTFAILRSLPHRIRKRTVVAAAAELYFGLKGEARVRSLRVVLGSMLIPLLFNIVPFSREAFVSKSLALMGDLLDDGWSVLIYPEGERSRTGEMGEFRPGVGFVAAEMLVPVVPVKLSGSFDPLSIFMGQKNRTQVCFGKPVDYAGRKDYALVAKELEGVIRAL